MIEVLKGFPPNVLAFACSGHVTRVDYETVLIPTVESMLQQQAKVRLYYEIGADFSGLEAGAVLDDFKVGVEHLPRWERIAVVTDVEWIRLIVRAFTFLLPGQVKIFRLIDAGAARGWIREDH
jgi:hypothetical protein